MARHKITIYGPDMVPKGMILVDSELEAMTRIAQKLTASPDRSATYVVKYGGAVVFEGKDIPKMKGLYDD